MMKLSVFVFLICLMACRPENENTEKVRLITLEPGHFHAALVQKSMYEGVDSIVHVYSSGGNDLDLHLNRINGYNARQDNPTHWMEKVYIGSDFLEKMLNDKPGNVVVLSGNNEQKTEYIQRSLQAGMHVLADKPMVINSKNFQLLKKAFELASKNEILLYDIMTERFEITTILQRELSQMPEIFGQLEIGTPENPAITKESVHHFYKYVSGSVLTRPAWFMDVEQQGEGLVDVMTHLVDLVQWECFPEQTLDTTDVNILIAKRWTTSMSNQQFGAITKLGDFPAYLKENILNDTLRIYCNGEISYQLKGVHAKTSVIWRYQAPEGTGDTHYSIMRGTRANLVIRQGEEEGFKPVLYIESVTNLEQDLKKSFKALEQKYPGLELKETKAGWKVVIPEHYHEGHEAHFARVTQKFLEYLKTKNMPEWEVPNMIVKYYTTTQALRISNKGN